MSKFKNMFTEEIEEEPIKKEVIQVEIPAPSKTDKEKAVDFVDSLVQIKEDPKMEVEEALPKDKKEEKFTFPVFFDDKDFDTLEKPKRETRSEKKVEPYGGAKTLDTPKEKPHVFKPTPVISPIYGVLDKNYKKEDITNRSENTEAYKENHSVNVDDIRNKAYGTLEDDLENTLLHNDFYEGPTLYKSEKDMFSEFDLLEDPVVTKSEEDPMNFDFPKLEKEQSHLEKEENRNDEIVIPTFEQDEDVKKETDDLFDLIDSMYEKGE